MIRDEASMPGDPAPAIFAGEKPTGIGPRLLGIAIAAIGLTNLWLGDFTIIYHPMPDFVPARALVAGLLNMALAVTGLAIAIAIRRMWIVGALTLAAVLLVLSTGWIIRVVMFPAMIGTWLGLAEQLALVTGAVAIFAQAPAAPPCLPAICRTTFGVFQIVFALGHFLSIPETIAMTPPYLPPGPLFWALATGVLHMVGGILLLSAIRPVLITRCLGAMFATFGLLVWLPMLVEGPSPATWTGNLINLSLVGAVLAVGDAIGARSTYDQLFPRSTRVIRA